MISEKSSFWKRNDIYLLRIKQYNKNYLRTDLDIQIGKREGGSKAEVQLSDTGLPAETVVENRKISDDLSNRLTFNGEEVDVIDNSPQETETKDQYVRIYTDPTAAGDCHNITHELPKDAKTVSFSTKMRFNDSWRNAGLRIMGTDAEGSTQKLFEVAMFTNQQAFLRTFNEGEPADGAMLFFNSGQDRLVDTGRRGRSGIS